MGRPKMLAALLATGAILGYAHGFASCARVHEHRRTALERHVAEVCLDAARGAERR